MSSPTRNGAPLIVGDTAFIAGLDAPALDQPVLNKQTGEIKVGDGEHRPSDLPAVPTPGGGGGDLSKLSAGLTDVTLDESGAAILPWALDVAEGSDIAIDPDDATKINVAAGAYLIQVACFPNGDTTAISGTVGYSFPSGSWVGGDGPATPASTSTPPAPWAMWWLYTSTAGSIKIHASFADAAPADAVTSGGIDVIRLGD